MKSQIANNGGIPDTKRSKLRFPLSVKTLTKEGDDK